MQEILTATENYKELDGYLDRVGAKKILLVCGGSIKYLKLDGYFAELEERKGIKVVRFTDFQPNPKYESVEEGVKVFRENNCDMVAAVGGGSALDVAKCIKLYSNMDSNESYLKQEIIPNDVPLFAVPTTAGAGSEATRFAVIYFGGEKQSVGDYSCIPSAVLFDADCLKTLPVYQKKATMMDALSHAVESFWSVNSNDESMGYAREAIRMAAANMDGYLSNDDAANENMLRAANLAGKAINITQTTAGHAMCYKLTTLYGIAHGHAAALCNSVLIPYMIQHPELCTDPRGEKHLERVYEDIAAALGCERESLGETFAGMVAKLAFEPVTLKTAEDIGVLKTSVNPERLKNHPIKLTVDAIERLYGQILNVGE
ncbi:phosphonoacetaldehyde reductase [uncultured Ruminococcus sp.]|uniref:phosphonoacetaldehyde reductase n=1 Tax=uncultured Ruminococcus sp. TaxID=165186 RepID=UPI0025DF1556|nr:phosphonoacetaldehyde reductase [uncultured Ruminococcus sp.]